MLWDLSMQVTLKDLIRLLRKRFGVWDQAEWFRTELRTRRRKPNESLQSLSSDVIGVSETHLGCSECSWYRRVPGGSG